MTVSDYVVAEQGNIVCIKVNRIGFDRIGSVRIGFGGVASNFIAVGTLSILAVESTA